MAIKREDYMKFLKKYKDKNCPAISKMKKAELKIEAEKRGFLQERFGITPAPATPAPKKKTERKVAVASAVPAKMTRKEIFQKISELEKVDMVNMTKSEARKVAQKKKKLFEMLKSVQSA